MTPAFDVDPSDCSGALARLAAIGFSEASVSDRLGLADLNDLQVRAIPIYRQERLRERDLLASAIDLFLLQGAVLKAEVDQLFDPTAQEALGRAGILEADGEQVRARISLYPVGSELIFSDHACPQLERDGSSTVPHDQVMYVGTDSRWLARITQRKPVSASLDLCTGSGIHALLAAAHAGLATAVDINPRAVRCTAFNAKAKGLANLEALQGDLYSPVGDRRFDLITANPPFVPAPVQEVGYRDGGPSGEEILSRIVAGFPGHLAMGGTAQIVTELGEHEGESLEPRFRQWLQGAPFDIHVLRLRYIPAQTYAIGHAHGEDYAAFLDSVGAWAANLKAHGYHRVISVLLTFQWSEAPWYRVDEAFPPASFRAGEELTDLLSAERLVRAPGLRERLAAGKVLRTGPVALTARRVLGAHVLPVLEARRLGQAMAVDQLLNPLEHDLLGALDHPVPLAELLTVAARTATTDEAVMAALVSLIRKGLVQLWP